MLPRLPRLDKGSARLPKLPVMPGPRAPSVMVRIDPSLPTRTEQERRPWQTPPPDWPGSPPEWAIYWSHQLAEPPRGPEGGEWNYQVPLFGSFMPAGFIPDFSEYDVRVTININEEDTDISLERYRALILFALDPPYTHVIIDEEDATTNPIFYLNEALAGRSHSRYGNLI